MVKPSSKPATAKKEEGSTKETSSKKRGWNEIEDLFDTKKKNDKAAAKQEETKRRERKAQHRKKQNARELQADEFAAQKRATDTKTWVDDGLGGKFNAEGYTGRVEDGVKIFKAHVLSKPDAGNTPQCPFDCDCCYI